MSTRGLLITFEGGEGAGKSTQIRRLATALEAGGRGVVVTREPGGTPVAEAIRALLLGPEASPDAMTQVLLFAAARREHIWRLIEPALAAGRIVLCDRFVDSTRAYQGGRLPHAALETTITLATGALKPDLTLLLDLPPATGLARARRRGGAEDSYERADIGYHEGVRARFLALAASEPGRIVVIDADAGPDPVARVIEAAVTARLPGLLR